MEPNRFTLLGAKRSAILVSGKFCTNTNKPGRWIDLAPPKSNGEGLFLTPAGLRYALLVVIKTTAQIMPCQQTSKTGQMIQYDRNML